jgi:hypothetical protein
LVEPSNVVRLSQQLQPFLRLKQKQANLVLKIIEQLPFSRDSQESFLKLCHLVDQVAELNDTKKRKHTAASVSAMLKEFKENDVPVETLGHEMETQDTFSCGRLYNTPTPTCPLAEVVQDPAADKRMKT